MDRPRFVPRDDAPSESLGKERILQRPTLLWACGRGGMKPLECEQTGFFGIPTRASTNFDAYALKGVPLFASLHGGGSTNCTSPGVWREVSLKQLS